MNNLETGKEYLEKFKLVFLYGLISCNDKEREVNLWKFFSLPAMLSAQVEYISPLLFVASVNYSTFIPTRGYLLKKIDNHRIIEVAEDSSRNPPKQ